MMTRSGLVLIQAAIALALLLGPGTSPAQPPPIEFRGGTSPWYASDAITVMPDPPLAGFPTEICVLLVNPTDTGHDVLLRYYVGGFAIGASFTPLGDSVIHLPPQSSVQDCKHWVPPVIGHWSIQARLMMTNYDDAVVERNIDMFETLEPLTPDTLAFVVRNTTPSTATISLGLVPNLPGWGLDLSHDVIPGLPAGGQQTVQLITTPPAAMPAVDGVVVTDVVAYIGGDVLGGFRKVYRSAAPCNGARLDLTPQTAAVSGVGDDEERGAYVTAIRGFQLCALGMELALETPQSLTARIYQANGTTRGVLLAQSTATALRAGKTFHYVPVSFELLPCQDYDISFEFSGPADFDYHNENDGFEPFDVGGVIRVRDGEYFGSTSNFALPRISLIGSLPGDQIITDLTPEGIEWSSCGDATTDRGAYVIPHRTINVSALGFAANFSAVPVVLNARIYEGAGQSRGDMIAQGSSVVASTGLTMHMIPIAAVLEEGKEYDLAIEFPATSWSCVGENQASLPFTADGVLSVMDGELAGNPGNTILPHLAVQWTEGAGGHPFSLAKTTDDYPPPFISTASNTNYGLFVMSIVNQDVFSLGWEADVQPGEPLYAWVYEASGTSRGALISSGSTVAVEGEPRWHDIPVAATFQEGTQYNIEIGFGQTNAWRFWEDYAGMPYANYGLFEVYAASQGGSTSGHTIIHMRVNACTATATGIDPRPAKPPRFTLGAPYPNPASGTTSLGFSIDRAGPVTIRVYDVAGRRVAQLLDGAVRPAGPGQVQLDTRSMAAGVYFVKMEMGARSVSRKITVVR